MAFHIQSVNLLSKLASALGHGGGVRGREGGEGGSPWLPSSRTERWKQVCLCVNTAMMLLETQQAAKTLLGCSPPGLILDFAHVERGWVRGVVAAVQVAFSQREKEGKKKQFLFKRFLKSYLEAAEM